ncbi:MAG: hypothetical protein AB1779_09480, partial [Candidatus Thermoplasmatota archaeon]
MHIAQVCIRFNAPGGVEKNVLEVSKELLKRGHEVTIFTSDIYTEVPWERREEWNDDELGINV